MTTVSRLFSSGAFFWPLSSLFITALSIIYSSPGPNYEGGASYIFFIGFYSILTIVFSQRKLKDYELGPIVFSIGVIPLLFVTPLFENDHYRYLWEGMAFLKGSNPYLHAPDSSALEHLSFLYKDRIGFSNLTSIYPPLSLLWFGLGGVMGFKLGYLVLIILNSFLVYKLLKLIGFVRPVYLLLLFPYLQKEFISAVHIDLLSFLGVLYFLISLKSKEKSLKGLVFSVWTKFLGLAPLALGCFYGLLFGRKLRVLGALVLSALLPLCLYYLTNGFSSSNGMSEFSSSWIWNPGFYSILTRIFNLSAEQARQGTLTCLGIFYLLIGLWYLRNLKGSKEYELTLKMTFYIFLGLMFFTPVYNGWYAIWFFIPAAMLDNRFGVLYGVSSCLCYISYGYPELRPLGEFLTHIWFIPSLLCTRAICSSEDTKLSTETVV